jgi:hypothetical protein
MNSLKKVIKEMFKEYTTNRLYRNEYDAFYQAVTAHLVELNTTQTVNKRLTDSYLPSTGMMDYIKETNVRNLVDGVLEGKLYQQEEEILEEVPDEIRIKTKLIVLNPN